MDEVYLFLDTMVFLHYQPLSDIDWCSLVRSERTQLVVTRSVLRELDRHKNEQRSTRLRERARRSLKTIEAAATPGSDAQIRPAVTLVISQDVPAVDLSALGLNPTWADDMHLASAVVFMAEHKDARVLFVTADVGARIKARQLGLETLDLPSEIRLPEDPDPLESEIRALKRKLAAASLPIVPELQLTFPDDSTRLFIPIRPESGYNSHAQEMESVREKYPLASQSKITPALLLLQGLSQPDVDKYNKRLSNFYKRYEHHLVVIDQIREAMARTFAITIVLHNDGRAVAENIDIHLLFPRTVTLLTTEELEKDPVAPKPPAPLQSPLISGLFPSGSYAGDPIQFGRGMDLVHGIQSLHAPKPNVEGPWTESAEPAAASWHVDHLKHGYQLELEPIYVRFLTATTVAPFSLPCRVSAANIPDVTKGILHVIFDQGERV